MYLRPRVQHPLMSYVFFYSNEHPCSKFKQNLLLFQFITFAICWHSLLYIIKRFGTPKKKTQDPSLRVSVRHFQDTPYDTCWTTKTSVLNKIVYLLYFDTPRPVFDTYTTLIRAMSKQLRQIFEIFFLSLYSTHRRYKS